MKTFLCSSSRLASGLSSAMILFATVLMSSPRSGRAQVCGGRSGASNRTLALRFGVAIAIQHAQSLVLGIGEPRCRQTSQVRVEQLSANVRAAADRMGG